MKKLILVKNADAQAFHMEDENGAVQRCPYNPQQMYAAGGGNMLVMPNPCSSACPFFEIQKVGTSEKATHVFLKCKSVSLVVTDQEQRNIITGPVLAKA